MLGVPFHVLRKKNLKNQSMHGGGTKLQSQIEMQKTKKIRPPYWRNSTDKGKNTSVVLLRALTST